ncbi:glycine betaine ABC transporter substrate-binding protein [Bacillus gobiensis]|uniref:ABC transporter substrate-binding protein n=1 Tax=Bacillus gobiensis TaxID=1441095 RepID=UPI003D247580
MKKLNKLRKSKLQTTLSIILALTLLFITSGCGNTATSDSSGSDEIAIATKGFAESDILANIIKQLIENETDLKTNIKTLDNKLLWDAIASGEIDTYVEYTGTALINLLKHDPIYDADKVYSTVSEQLKEKYKITTLDPIGFNNTYAFTIQKDKADKYNIKTISDLAKVSDQLVLGASQEYIKRPDSWPILEKTYHLKFKEIKSIQEKSLQFQAVKQNLINSMIAYSTDSQIPQNGLVTLKDDKNVFLPYNAVPIIRDETLNKHPELKNILNKLSGKITDEDMQKLNGEVELKQRPAADVAKEWLQQQGLIK